MTRKYLSPADAKGEELEKFSEKFLPFQSSSKPVKRKKEHPFDVKKLLKINNSQLKINSFLKDVDLKLGTLNLFDSDDVLVGKDSEI